jgi:hypothetical protein
MSVPTEEEILLYVSANAAVLKLMNQLIASGIHPEMISSVLVVNGLTMLKSILSDEEFDSHMKEIYETKDRIPKTL